MPYALKLLTALLLTEAIELIACYLLGARGKNLLIVLLANLITNPSLNVLFGLCYLYAPGFALIALIALEIGAVLIEWRIYSHLTDATRPFLLSLIANAVSFAIGWMMMIL